MTSINPELLRMARSTISRQQFIKQSFQPPAIPTDPAAGMSMDPSMMGVPTGGDPAAMGAAPPSDPAAASGAGGLTADSVRQIVMDTMTQTNAQGGAGGGMGKPAKPDIVTVASDIYQVKVMLITLFNHLDIKLPDTLILGPNRDPATGAATPPGMPGSTSDPATMQAQTQPQSAGGEMAPPTQPMPAPTSGGGEKSSAERVGRAVSLKTSAEQVTNKANALGALLRRKMKI